MPTNTRERRVRAAVPCPLCKAPAGQPCMEFSTYAMPHSHPARRQAWLEAKHAAERATGAALAGMRPHMQPPADVSREPQFVCDDGPGPMTTVEIWRDGEHAATLTAGLPGLLIVCQPGWDIGRTATTQGTGGLAVGIIRAQESKP